MQKKILCHSEKLTKNKHQGQWEKRTSYVS